jgi:hypothetical protein
VIAELSGVVALAVALLMSVAVALLAFMVLVQPIWCIIDCAIDRKRSAGGKAVWIVILILLWASPTGSTAHWPPPESRCARSPARRGSSLSCW